MLPKGYKTILDWFQDVASDPDYENPHFLRYSDNDSDDESVEMEGGIPLDNVMNDS